MDSNINDTKTGDKMNAGYEPKTTPGRRLTGGKGFARCAGCSYLGCRSTTRQMVCRGCEKAPMHSAPESRTADGLSPRGENCDCGCGGDAEVCRYVKNGKNLRRSVFGY